MVERYESCPIWPGHGETVRSTHEGSLLVTSARADGSYMMEHDVAMSHFVLSSTLDDSARARLTTWLIEQRQQGISIPRITHEIVENAKNRRPLSAHDRGEKVLKYLADNTANLGQPVEIGEGSRNYYGEFIAVLDSRSVQNVLARSESTQWSEVAFLIEYLTENGWVKPSSLAQYYAQCTVTVEGHNHIAALSNSADSLQAFVAMWFDDSMNDVYRNGFDPGIKDAGYSPFRIDRAEFINKIDDEIIAEIRRSKFLVADFTQGDDGARGSVYYEAGFAHGFGLPVIFTCHSNFIGKLHFDTNHYPHIGWTDAKDLRKKLSNRIRAVIR